MTILKYAGKPGDDKIPEFFRGAQFYVVGKTTKSVSVTIGVKTGNGDMYTDYPPKNDPKHLLSSKVSDKLGQIRGYRIDERGEGGEFYRDGVRNFTAEELDDMLEEAYKEVVRHHVDDLSQDVLEDEEHPTTIEMATKKDKAIEKYANKLYKSELPLLKEKLKREEGRFTTDDDYKKKGRRVSPSSSQGKVVVDKHKRVCAICEKKYDKDPEDFQIHHVDGDRTHTVTGNLIPACHSCHKKIHTIANAKLKDYSVKHKRKKKS